MMKIRFEYQAHVGWACKRIWYRTRYDDLETLARFVRLERKMWLSFVKELKSLYHPDSSIPYPGLFWHSEARERTPIYVMEMWVRGWEQVDGSVRSIAISSIISRGNDGIY